MMFTAAQAYRAGFAAGRAVRAGTSPRGRMWERGAGRQAARALRADWRQRALRADRLGYARGIGYDG